MLRNINLSIPVFLIAVTTASAQVGTVDLPDSIADPGVEVIWVQQVPSYCEGPAVDSNGMLYFTEQIGNAPNWPIWKVDPSDPNNGEVFIAEARQANGLQFDINWMLVAAQNERITRYNDDGSVDSILVESGTDGVNFNQANDLSVASDGNIYFTDLRSEVFFADTNGNLRSVYNNASGANGIEYIEEEGLVYLNEAGGGRVTLFDVGENGALENPRTYINAPVPDGGTFDIHGNYYTASYGDGAVIVFNADGDEIGRITLNAEGEFDARNGQQGNTSNCAFGGPENRTLYITGDGGAYSIELNIPGRTLPPLPVGIRNLRPGPGLNFVPGQTVYYPASRVPWSYLTGQVEFTVFDVRNRLLGEWTADFSATGADYGIRNYAALRGNIIRLRVLTQ
jgi:gluconolactonase